MDILIPDKWLREFLKTDATVKEIAKDVSLCGPSVERINKTEYGDVYAIEVTTNRVDSASVYGIAREASATLPRFGIKANLSKLTKKTNYRFSKKVNYLSVVVDHNLCPRFSAVLIKNVKIGESPNWMKERLLASDVRPINNIVDISNDIMLEIGQPVHTFDYDKILKSKMILRESKKDEKVTTLDGKIYQLPGGDIVIEDGSGRLIDLCGIMGGKNSQVDEKTKNVLLFVQNYNPAKIRKTSMKLAARSKAASLFEKGIDSELVETGILKGIELFEKLIKGTAQKQILDLYPNPFKSKEIKVDLKDIYKKLGVEITKAEISKILSSLEFEVSWKGNTLIINPPSFRAADIEIPEDVMEEIARMYGYHNFPSKLMTGEFPQKLTDAPFTFEDKVKDILKGYGGCEVYTLSLVSFNETSPNSLSLKNPLGAETEYLRTSLLKSLTSAAEKNNGEKEPFHLFEMANIYLPKTYDLPEEKMILAGIFVNTNYRESKGVIESLLSELNIGAEFIQEDMKDFLPSQRLTIKHNEKTIGELGNLENNNLTYYEFSIEELRKLYKPFGSYKEIPQNPPQIEDITFTFPEKTRIGDVIAFIKKSENYISRVDLKDIYKESFTFRIYYQHPTKTLNNQEVEQIRNKVLNEVKNKFGGVVKN